MALFLGRLPRLLSRCHRRRRRLRRLFIKRQLPTRETRGKSLSARQIGVAYLTERSQRTLGPRGFEPRVVPRQGRAPLKIKPCRLSQMTRRISARVDLKFMRLQRRTVCGRPLRARVCDLHPSRVVGRAPKNSKHQRRASFRADIKRRLLLREVAQNE
ncbi:hypothetical protein BVI2075_200057 [Burkholderia vietnamiensis]|nr:hypothetical protein BVI2075_200057 [Burkholderia vietnamiensis]